MEKGLDTVQQNRCAEFGGGHCVGTNVEGLARLPRRQALGPHISRRVAGDFSVVADGSVPSRCRRGNAVTLETSG